MANGNS